MSAHGERTLILHLVNPDSLEIMGREGVPLEIIPDSDLRQIVRWTMDYYFRAGRERAPSVEAIRGVEVGGSTFGGILDDHEIELGDEPDDSVEWALDDLRSSYVHRRAQTFNKEWAMAMSNAEATDRLDVLAQGATELLELSITMERRDRHVDVREAMAQTIQDYEGRAASGQSFRGMTLGFPEIDAHTHGVRDGELATWAAGPKVGKSYAMAWVALSEWRAGRSPALFTLENSVEMTLDRIACLACGIDSERWQIGECTEEEVNAAHEFLDELAKSNNPLWVLRPDASACSFPALVREAQVREADSILIDQLSHVELPDGRKPKTERIGDALQVLTNLITDGRNAIPCLLAHQINREGVKASRKLGYLEMEHLAESAAVERYSDWVFGAYASPDDVVLHNIKLQTLAARRAKIKNWEVKFYTAVGQLNVIREYDL